MATVVEATNATGVDDAGAAGIVVVVAVVSFTAAAVGWAAGLQNAGAALLVVFCNITMCVGAVNVICSREWAGRM